MSFRLTHCTLRPIIRIAALGPVAALAGCVSVNAARRSDDPEPGLKPQRNCIGLLAEATAALSGAAADTSVSAVMTAHTRHAAKMAEYHACLAEDP